MLRRPLPWLTAALLLAGVAILAVAAPLGCDGTPDPSSPAPDPPPVAPSPTAHLDRAGSPGFTPRPLDDAMALLDDRPDWADHARPIDVPRHPAEKYLEGWVIVLDPGHGGQADVAGYKRGPTGVREAEMNLRVTRLLRRLLEDAGAYVTLTRDAETSDAADDRLPDTLKRRADVANTLPRPDGGTGADLFLSIHHNASSRPTANFPSVWFHGQADWSEPSLDVARYLANHLGTQLRPDEVGLTSLLMSDQQIVPSTGFGVLRHARVPAVLTEASFFSHPVEEQRLRDAVYNLREAYALYLGLVEYAYGGRPTQSLPVASLDGDTLTLTTTLDEGLPDWWGHERQRILSSTLAVYLDDRRLDAAFDPATQRLTATAEIDRSRLGDIDAVPLRIHHQNFHKHSNWPQTYTLDLTDPDPDAIAVRQAPPRNADRAAPPARVITE
jgi:N-acetylmuramoyl-L-alanine amidase